MPSRRPDTLTLLSVPARARVFAIGLAPAEQEQIATLVDATELTALEFGEPIALVAVIAQAEPDLVVACCPSEAELLLVRQLKASAETHFVPIIVLAHGSVRRAAYVAGADHAAETIDDDIAARGPALLRSAAVARAVRSSRQELRLRRDWIRYLVHDLRNLMTKALGYLSLAAGRGGNDPLGQEYLARCEEELWRGTSLLGDILDVDRIKKGQLHLRRSPIDLAELASRVVETFRETATRASIGLALEAAAAVSVLVDGPLIERLLGNLIANGLHYAPSGSSLVIQVAMGDGHAVLSVENHGPSIPPERVSELFEPFVTIDSGGRAGMGLGLAFCRLVAELHDGAIRVVEPPGGGARFNVSLPLC